MLSRTRLLLAVLVSLFALAGLAGPATAASFSINPAGNITATSLGAVTYSAGFANIVCLETYVGSLSSGTIAKVDGTQIGSITSATATSCSFGAVSSLLAAAWPVVYRSITGTLPSAVTAVRLEITNKKRLITMSGISSNCLYSGNIRLSLNVTGSNPYTTTLMNVNNTLGGNTMALFTTLSGICPSTATATGTFSLTPTQTLTRL